MQSTPETLPLFPGLVPPPPPQPVRDDHAEQVGAEQRGTEQRDAAQRNTEQRDAEKRGAEQRCGDHALHGKHIQQEPQLTLLQSPRQHGLTQSADSQTDPHMAIAWRLSKAMKGVKSGQREARNLRRMTPRQRHQVGNVICGHLLASLRAQVAAESRTVSFKAQAN